MKIWVVYEESDYEGCSSPLGAYSSPELAEQARLKIDRVMAAVKEIVLDAPPVEY